MPVAPQEVPVYETLNRLGIPFERFEHPPVATVEEAQQYDDLHEGGHCKNFFLRDKKGVQHFLVILLAGTEVDLSNLAKNLKCGHLSFASHERLFKYLGLLPGSVGPFGLINDHFHVVRVIIDRALLLEEKVGFHPNVNTATVVVKVSDLQDFLKDCGNEVEVRDFD
ncbi:MAG: prolyl-tRNA synthetase associated domain-containing protein [Leptolinea sp.]